MRRDGIILWGAVILVGVGVAVGGLSWLSSRNEVEAPPGVRLWSYEDHLARHWNVEIDRWNEVEDFSLELKNVTLETVVFDELPLRQCLEEINQQLRELDGVSEIDFVYRDEVLMESPVTLKLYGARLSEVIKYTLAQNSATYQLGPDRRIRVFHWAALSEPIDEGWFRPPRGLFRARGSGPIVIREELEQVGISFPTGSLSIYYPDAGLLWARNGISQLELIEAYFEMGPQSFRERLRQWHVYDSPWSRWVPNPDPFAP